MPRAEGLGLVRDAPLGLVRGADADLELAEEAEQFVLATEAGLELRQHAEEVGDLAAGAVDQVTLLFQGGELLGGLFGEGAEHTDLVLHLRQALALLLHGAHDAGGRAGPLLDGGDLRLGAGPRLVEGGEAHHGPFQRGRERVDGPELLFQGGDPLAQYGSHGGTVTRLRCLQFAGGRLGARDEGLQAAALALDGGQHRTDLTGGGAGVLALEALRKVIGKAPSA